MTQLAAVVEVPTGRAGMVKVREITLAEVRAHLAGAVARESAVPAVPDRGDLFIGTLLGGFSLEDLKRFTDLDDALMGEVTPSEFRAIFAKVKDLNPDFFAVLDRWADSLVDSMTSGLTSSVAP